MIVDEALTFIKKAANVRRLNAVQEIVFRQSWQGQSYAEIARVFGYERGYVKDTGYRLWKLLSEVLGEKVTKNNLRLVLERCQQQQQKEPMRTQGGIDRPIRHNLPVRRYSIFLNRDKAMSQLLEWMEDDRAFPWLVIEGVEGVGKTTLALEAAFRCLNEEFCSFEAIVFVSAQREYLTPYGLVPRLKPDRTLGDILGAIAQTLNCSEELEADFETTYNEVRASLRRQRTLLIMDCWEAFTEPQRILAFLYDLPSTVKTLLTSRQRSPFDTIKLQPLSETESLKFMDCCAQTAGILLSLGERQMLYRQTGGLPAQIRNAIARMTDRLAVV